MIRENSCFVVILYVCFVFFREIKMKENKKKLKILLYK